ncbi:alpha/beta hydrolase family protein [Seonamhaeicola marinus]|uniref:Uncharacterized protein n=1 Tax=Seonamhaeicola marinus TaxID=1912246 RepID=A0A5D0I4T3_9FLAO|nr:hypothetical protein [Seonamhaeicola marinus]TYA78706.1 hypothetical protein FUA24_10160 [Seonamhaeicola marinus]
MTDVSAESILEHSRGVNVKYNENKVLELSDLGKTPKERYKWIGVPISKLGQKLNRYQNITATLKNTGAASLKTLLWVNSNKGWNSVADTLTIHPGELKRLSCNLRELFPDGTSKINPNYIYEVQVMFDKANSVKVELLDLKASNIIKEWKRPEHRLDVPEMKIGLPKAGQRVQYKLDKDSLKDFYSVLYLPENWKANRLKKYPVIVEFPGNVFYVRNCYSTGRPEDCVIGYGMSKGKEAIWISMPFVDYKTNAIAENGWGHPDDTADYTIKMVQEVIAKFNGDKDNIIITGFSRGAIACGFIGLRNDTIASLWKGMHCCQHFDGDGWGGATEVDAKARLNRLGAISVFQTDNDKTKLKNLLKEVNATVIYESSGLNAHACDMFLDNRASTQKLRQWFTTLISE